MMILAVVSTLQSSQTYSSAASSGGCSRTSCASARSSVCTTCTKTSKKSVKTSSGTSASSRALCLSGRATQKVSKTTSRTGTSSCTSSATCATEKTAEELVKLALVHGLLLDETADLGRVLSRELSARRGINPSLRNTGEWCWCSYGRSGQCGDNDGCVELHDERCEYEENCRQ
jgi:hypothetical protein